MSVHRILAAAVISMAAFGVTAAAQQGWPAVFSPGQQIAPGVRASIPQIAVPRSTPAPQGQTPIQGAFSTSIRVDARRPWTSTNVSVRQGDRLRFQASGEVRPVPGGGGVGPAGGTATDPTFPVPAAGIGALIGRVGNGQPFVIGASGAAVEMPNDGQLFLGINDNNVNDNSGMFVVRVSRAGAVAGTTGQSSALGQPVTVQGNQPWTPTGITVNQGDRLVFTLSGRVTWAHGPHDQTTGEGGPIDPARQKDYPVPGVGVAALIGRAGNGPAFAIGRTGQAVVMPSGGELFLGINDDYFGDNDGSYSVSIRRQ